MATRNVIKPFKLTTIKGVIEFDSGTQEIDDKLINHWFVKAHLEPLKAKPDEGGKGPVDPAAAEPGGDAGDDGKKSDQKGNSGPKKE
ncbi:hypothetical protein ACIQVE_07095 [Pseudomonas sp. NPDC098747]|uniref:STY1053 family phage-associated protein n=1 Tax=Pseudomonas sp. NPDC098747 TaxID=3364487 RepID=UPI00383B1263